MNKTHAILFDLDGTLIDSNPEIVAAINHVRAIHGVAPISLEKMRPYISLGAAQMIKISSPELVETQNFDELLQAMLESYQAKILNPPQLYPGIHEALTWLTEQNTPWGIVTNKNTQLTEAILKHDTPLQHHQALVCGDTLPECKPDPAPLSLACEQLQVAPDQCIYAGDASTDMAACHALNMPGWIAKYGYIHPKDNPESWPHSAIIDCPTQLLSLIKAHFSEQ